MDGMMSGGSDKSPYGSEEPLMRTAATTAEEYLAELPEERREAIATVRDLVNEHLPSGYEESMSFGMITWSVPLERLPDTYNGQPLGYIALANQKNYMTLYLMSAYGGEETWFREEYAKSGKKLDMGKSCVRFKTLDDLALEPIAKAVERTPIDAYIARYREARAQTKAGR
jgi:hypothetical protein